MSLQQTDNFLLSRAGSLFRAPFTDLQTAVLAALPQPICGRVASDGTGLMLAGASVVRVSTGEYQITFDQPRESDTYPVLLTLEQNQNRDDYIVAFADTTVSGFIVEVNEQDNSTKAGTPRNAGFSFLLPFSSVI